MRTRTGFNLEYLESEYYLRAATGQGLSTKNTEGVGTQGKVVGGSKVPFKDTNRARPKLVLYSLLPSRHVCDPHRLRNRWRDEVDVGPRLDNEHRAADQGSAPASA
jgi:hypothetical protein